MYTNFRLRFWFGLGLSLCLLTTALADEADDAYAVATGHYSNGRWALAEQEFSRFLQQYPDHSQSVTATLFLAESQVQQGKHSTAKGGFQQFLGLAPEHRFAGHATFRIAEASHLLGDAKTAGAQLEAFCRRYPDDPMNAYALNYLGAIALSSDDSEQARRWYTEAVRRFPDGPLIDESRFGLARAMELQGEHESALVVYRIVVASGGRLADDAQLQIGISHYNRRQYTKAIEAFAATVGNFPDSDRLAAAKHWLGMSHIARGEWIAAVKALTDAAESFPTHELTGPTLFWLGEAYRHLEDTERALHCYRAVSKEWSDCPWADASLLAETRIQLADQRHEEVNRLADEFARSHSESPLAAEVQRVWSRSLLKQRRYEDAIAVLSELVADELIPSDDAEQRIAPGVVSAGESALRGTDWYYLGIACLGAEQPELALDALARVRPGPDEQALREGLWVAKATALLAADQCAEAIDPLMQYLAVQPNGAEATKCRIHLMVALARSGRLDDALQAQNVLTDTDRAHASYLPAVQRVAEAAYEAGRYDAATRLFRILTRETSPPEIAAHGWSGLGWACFSSGDLESATGAFGKLVSLYPDSKLAPEAAMMQAKAYEKMDRPEEASDAYDVVSTAFAAQDHAAEALFENARLKEQLGDKAQAVDDLKRIVDDHAEFGQMDSVLYQLAWLLMDLGRSDEAVARFQQLADGYPSSVYRTDALYRLAEHAARAQQTVQAVQLLDQIIQAKGTPEILVHALYLKGQLAASQQRWPDVVAPMQTLIDEFPNSPLAQPARYWVAESLFQQGDRDLAFQWFSELQEISKDDQEGWMAMVALRRAQILTARKQWRLAYDAANSIKQRFPGFRQQYEADYVSGRCLAMQAKFSEARARFEEVIRSPEGGGTETAAMAQWMIGESYMHQQKYDEALRAFYRVESLFAYPHWRAAALLQAGKCHAIQGEDEQAEKLFAQVVGEHAESPFAEEAAQRLQRLDANGMEHERRDRLGLKTLDL